MIQAAPDLQVRDSVFEATLEPDAHNGLTRRVGSACRHSRGIATTRVGGPPGNVGPAGPCRIRDVIGIILDE